MCISRNVQLLFVLLLASRIIFSQNVGINVTNPLFTMDIRPTSAANSSIINVSDLLGDEYFQIIGPNSTDLNSTFFWKKGMTLNFSLYDSVEKMTKNYLTFDGRGIGVYNTGYSLFIGEGAGSVDDLTSNHNVGLGNLSLNLNVTGVSNVAVGSGSLRNNISGNDNVGVGRNAGLYVADGHFNVAVGHSAMHSNLSGSRNTIIGSRAGFGTSGNSFSGNVMIGYSAGRNETNSDRLYIDNSNTSDPLIYGEFDSNLLKVNGNAEVTGNLNLGNSEEVPETGDVRFNAASKDFEGFDGEKWLSLTKGNQLEWGYASGLRTEKHAAVPSDGQDDDLFGFSVDISGDYAIVGAPGAGNGKAYIFHYLDQFWLEEAILTDPNGQLGYQFGYSVAISGDYALVGAPYSNYENGTASGRALFFERNGTSWTLKATEEPNTPNSGDNFGFAVSMDGDYAAIGVPGETITVTNQGTVYIMYNINGGWSNPAAKVVFAPNPTPQAGDGLFPDAFGQSVDISGDKVVVGAPGRNDSIPNTTDINEASGAVYLFQRGANWTIWNTVSTGFDQFYYWDFVGSEVSIFNDILCFSYSYNNSPYFQIVDGSGPNGWISPGIRNFPVENYANISSDGEYVMKGNTIYQDLHNDWQINAKLTTSDYHGSVTNYTNSNYSVAISGGKIVLGNPDYAIGPNSGKVYFYHK